mmetsp:Transcript_107534/g.321603  ORF Transcript_107534/g.321603 Transcript_107534/m.321603 type:complete len:231 (+) Transcript_107534:503-1195(+)
MSLTSLSMCISQWPSSHWRMCAGTGPLRPLTMGRMPVAWNRAALRRRLSKPSAWAFMRMLPTCGSTSAPVFGLLVIMTSTVVLLAGPLACKNVSLGSLGLGPGLKDTKMFTCSPGATTDAAALAGIADGGAGEGTGGAAARPTPPTAAGEGAHFSGASEPGRGIGEAGKAMDASKCCPASLTFPRPSSISVPITWSTVKATVSPKSSPVSRKAPASLLVEVSPMSCSILL